MIDGGEVEADQADALCAEPRGDVRREGGDARGEGGFVVAVIGTHEHARRGAGIETGEVFPGEDHRVAGEENTCGAEENVEVELVDGKTGVIVVERGVHVRAAVDTAGETTDVARGAVAHALGEFEVEPGVTGPRGGGVGERVGDVDEGMVKSEKGGGGLSRNT